MTYEPGDVFAGYGLVRLLGKGGMGSVYLAKHPRLPRHDALKVLSDAYSGDETYRTRFEREADLAAQLSHRNVVAVYDRGSQEQTLWIAMQYVAGTDAAQALRQGPMHADRAAHIVSEIGRGLHYAHLQGMVHRDVKPANILLQASVDSADPENVLLADFGIAKLDSTGSTLTGEGNFLGTLPYTAPEVLNGAASGPAVDTYALGCVLFELLTGRVPFPVTSPLAAMNAHLNTPPPKPSELVFGVPGALDAVVQRAMAKDPAERYASCRELALAVRSAVHLERDEHSENGDDSESTSQAAGRPRPPYTLTVRRYPPNGAAQQLGPVDTAAGSTAERGALETMLRASSFFSLPLRLPLVRKVDGDPFIEFTVSGAGNEHTVGFELEGSRHPIELGLIIGRLEQVTGWRPLETEQHEQATETRRVSLGTNAGPIPAPPTRAPVSGSLPAAAPSRPPSGSVPVSGQPIRPAPGPSSSPIPLVPGPSSQPIRTTNGPRSWPSIPAPYGHHTAGAHHQDSGQPAYGGPRIPSGPIRLTTASTARRTGASPAELTGLGIAVLLSFGLFFASPVAGLIAVVVVVLAAVALLLVRHRR